MSSRKCSVGDMSGEHAGHGNTLTSVASCSIHCLCPALSC